MRTRRPLLAVVATLAAALATPLGLVHSADARPGPGGSAAGGTVSRSELGSYSTDYFSKHRKLNRQASERALRAARVHARRAPGVGDEKVWPAIDFVSGQIYLKRYVLRGQGDHIQVWVANDRAFPTDDCRNDLGLTDISDRQVRDFVRQFDNRILPIESQAFSVAPDQDGSASGALAASLDLPRSYWKVGTRQADDTVALIDNVRDENYYTPNTPEGRTRVGGFFTPQFTELFDRNMMTVDSYDWRHQSGANPPDDSQDPAYVACGEELGAPEGRLGRPEPRGYEGTFAHEYQHLLESYEDADELSWVNEGLANYAQTITGYVNTRVSPSRTGTDSHLACFAGYWGRSFGGPENSLTTWGDQDNEPLCDYGAVYSFMQYVSDHYGPRFMSALHRNNRNGIQGLQRVLDRRAGGVDALTVFHRWSAMVALDGILDRNGGTLVGGRAQRFQAASLRSKVNWRTPEAYGEPGAPLNGSDYVRLRDASGDFLDAAELDSIEFSGSTTFEPEPVEWTVDATPPNGTDADTTCGAVPDGGGAAALYSGCGDEMDRSIVHEVSVPATGSPSLAFDVLYDIEEGWDFGFVQVSTDGGATWTSLSTENTTSEHDPDAFPYVVGELPGFTGESGTWTTQHADLSPYAGQDVLVGFRYITDEAAAEAGMWVRDIQVGAAALPSSSLSQWRTITQVHPEEVPGFAVQLVSYGSRRDAAYLARLRLDDAFEGSLSGAALADALGTTGTRVAAIVTADDPTEGFTDQARYVLTVNGVVQPGGGTP